jgi:hypothetical protein
VVDVDSKGPNSYAVLSYTINDDNSYQGISYYRLKKTDFDGQYSHSKTVAVDIQKLSLSQIEIYLNPTNNQIIAFQK